ncbi:MAG: hypothetical protein IPJ98_31545 [Bryobacterales bacterium]|nr:hypothetical protein [Bryobacterales bacterium]
MDILSAVSAAPAASEAAAATSAASAPDHRRLKQAATDFEGLLVAQLLRHARQAGDGGWMGTGEDKSSESMMEMAEESLARMMASQGCLGLASLMQQGVAQQEARAAAATTDSPATTPAAQPPAKP